MSETPQFFFNTRTGQVEELTKKGQSKDLLGPYPSREAAARALETAHERTEKWDEEDRRWNEGQK
ncbi:methionine aminopeptidase [Spongisporangium articulatum]|uniref:Methionine aminopeptidase n=1 Tax=Spongisporangium articulatum TaxID=3362603 RepID=A0ABW8ALU8_9ACTN